MQFVTCDVNTYCMGMAASMGAVLLCAGTKGKRFALPNSHVMIHQVSGGAQGTASDVERTVEFMYGLKRRLNAIIAHHTGKTAGAESKATPTATTTCAPRKPPPTASWTAFSKAAAKPRLTPTPEQTPHSGPIPYSRTVYFMTDIKYLQISCECGRVAEMSTKTDEMSEEEKALVGINAKTQFMGPELPGLRSWSGNRRRIKGPPGEGQYFHVMSRLTGDVPMWDALEKEAMVKLLWKMSAFCGVELLTYCVMGNHFHALVRVPDREGWLREKFGAAEVPDAAGAATP